MERNSSGAVRAPAARAWRLRRQRHIGSSCDALNLLALHHARLLSRSGAAAFGRGTADDAACGRAGAASGAAATFLSMRVCRRSIVGHARLLASSGAAAFGRSTSEGRSTSDGAASGRTGASGATLRVLRTHCGAAESGFIGRRQRLGRALYPPTDARFE
jgi:hypothetical protein